MTATMTKRGPKPVTLDELKISAEVFRVVGCDHRNARFDVDILGRASFDCHCGEHGLVPRIAARGFTQEGYECRKCEMCGEPSDKPKSHLCFDCRAIHRKERIDARRCAKRLAVCA